MSSNENENRTALARIEPTAALAMVQTPSEAEERLRELQEFIKRNMVEGEDYGAIPGVKAGKDEDGKPLSPRKVLLKPGAEKLAEIYGFAIDYVPSRPAIERWGDDGGEPFFAYFMKAIVTRRSDGRVMGSGIGSCNSREKKYAARWVFEREVPPGLDLSRLPQKTGEGRNGRPYTLYKVPNPEIYDLVNTIEKMAAKRAGVSAVISVTRSSGIFTQDLEDMAPEARGAKPVATEAEYEDAPPAGRNARPSPPSAFADVLIRERARWHKDGGDENTERVLAASPDPKDRKMVFEWRIGNAKDAAALAAVQQDIARDPHDEMRADMLVVAESRRKELEA